ncbi:hypothetical protein [Nannocystis pusilla]|uniref:hypothetical protein n=1 Tax=Nannocystis pusilla TaxID=889268 RepID=UPI003DA2BE49
MSKQRQDRGDMRLGTFEKKHGLPEGSLRNPDGSDARSDQRLDTFRNRWAEAEAAEKRK